MPENKKKEKEGLHKRQSWISACSYWKTQSLGRCMLRFTGNCARKSSLTFFLSSICFLSILFWWLKKSRTGGLRIAFVETHVQSTIDPQTLCVIVYYFPLLDVVIIVTRGCLLLMADRVTGLGGDLRCDICVSKITAVTQMQAVYWKKSTRRSVFCVNAKHIRML